MHCTSKEGELFLKLVPRYIAEVHSDGAAARLSPDHCRGGLEYYLKMLKRNQ